MTDRIGGVAITWQVIRVISDTLRRKLIEGLNRLSILHAMRGEFRDAVAEIRLPCQIGRNRLELA